MIAFSLHIESPSYFSRTEGVTCTPEAPGTVSESGWSNDELLQESYMSAHVLLS